ncbi:MAG: hypothetical protein ACJ75B_05585 [Flavisolibacter sp.]
MKAAFIVFLLLIACSVKSQDSVALKTAKAHPMQYYISLPRNWSMQKTWPVVVAVVDAEKDFKNFASQFARASAPFPFIVVTPLVVSNGSYGHRSSSVYPYSSSTWDRIDRDGACSFDIDGVMAVIREVQQKYHGASRIFITGFEAGAHLLWAMVFLHPELLFAAAPVSGNYIGRCLAEGSISKDSSRSNLPVISFYGTKDSLWNQFLKKQDEQARNLATAKGYRNVSIKAVAGKGHEPMANEVIEYFGRLNSLK